MTIEAMKKTLVLGIGNPILTDDAVGLRVAQNIGKLRKKNIQVAETCETGLALLEEITDHDKLIIIDSIKTGKGYPGEVYRFELEDLKVSSPFPTAHGLDMVTAFKMGEQAGCHIPRHISIYAIEVIENDTFGEKCTEEIESKIPDIARKIIMEEKL
jgi:hydrogenase maturation protease